MFFVRGLLVVAATVATAPAALAVGGYSDDVPNVSCNTCHTSTSVPAPRTTFGAAWASAKGSVGIAQAWGRVWDDDTDGDGQTNGQELGDPCGQFTSGGAEARTGQLSDPSNSSSTSSSPNAPDGDADGVSNGCDNCPNNANTNQNDADGDDIGDVCDASSGEGEGEGEGAAGEGEGEGVSGEGEGEGAGEGEGEGEGWTIGEGEGEGEGDEVIGFCSSSRVRTDVPRAGALSAALLAILVVGARRRRA